MSLANALSIIAIVVSLIGLWWQQVRFDKERKITDNRFEQEWIRDYWRESMAVASVAQGFVAMYSPVQVTARRSQSSDLDEWQAETLSEWEPIRLELARLGITHPSPMVKDEMTNLCRTIGQYVSELGALAYSSTTMLIGQTVNCEKWQSFANDRVDSAIGVLKEVQKS